MQPLATHSSSLTFTFISLQGAYGGLEISSRNLKWRASKRRYSHKACHSLIAAELELKPAHIELKPLPYALNSLEPYMSHKTLEYHWGKHHRGYVDKLNEQLVESELDGTTLEDIIISAYNKGDPLPVFNNAAQIWNHDFFWESMRSGGGGKPSGELLELIERDFGSYDGFVREFKAAASTQFGSGWAWLAYKANKLDVGNAIHPYPSEEHKKLVVVKSPNGVNPLVWDYSPLLTIDVWEHAYYLDYQNHRADYISIFLDKLVSWERVSSRLEMAKAKAREREMEEKRNENEDDDGEELPSEDELVGIDLNSETEELEED